MIRLLKKDKLSLFQYLLWAYMTGHKFKCPPGHVSNINGSLGTIKNGGEYGNWRDAPLLRVEPLSLVYYMGFKAWSFEQHPKHLGNPVDAATQVPTYAPESKLWGWRSQICLTKWLRDSDAYAGFRPLALVKLQDCDASLLTFSSIHIIFLIWNYPLWNCINV